MFEFGPEYDELSLGLNCCMDWRLLVDRLLAVADPSVFLISSRVDSFMMNHVDCVIDGLPTRVAAALLRFAQ